MRRIAAILAFWWLLAGSAYGSAQPIIGHSELLPEGAATATFVVTIGDVERSATSRIVFAALAEDEGALPQIALVAVPEQGWFSSGWELQLEVAPGVVAGDPNEVKLRGGLAAPFLFPGETYRTNLSFDADTGELSFALWNVTRDTEVYAGVLYLETQESRRLNVVSTGLMGFEENVARERFRVESVEVDRGYRGRGELLPLTQARAGMVNPATGRFVTAIGLNEGPLGIRITRPFGRLPGWFVVLVSEAGGQERTLLTLPAEPLELEVDLGERALPPGRHTVRVVYQPPRDGVGEFVEEEVRNMTLEVKPPRMSARVRFAPAVGAPLQEGAELEGRVELQADQPVEWLEVRVNTTQDEVLLQKRLGDVEAGSFDFPFSFKVERAADLLSPLQLKLEWADGDGLAQAVHPIRIALAMSSEMAEDTSYQQQVRRLVPPVEFDPESGAVGTYDLVELQVSAQMLEPMVVWVVFTSPSGEAFEVQGRRLVRPEVEGHWVARLLPAEAGRWHYRVTVSHPDWAPDAVELQSGEFVVRESGRQLPVVRREWGASEPKAEGQRVAALRYRRGNTVKLEQLIGDWDSHLDIPTLNQTLSDYGLIGTDLGQPFEHDGKVVYLFGDTMGTRGFIESSLASSWTEDPEKGLALDFYTDPTGYTLRIRPPGLSMGGFEVPSGGMSIDGTMYFIVKDQVTEEPGGMTFRSVLIRFDEESQEFIPVREFSPLRGKFAEVVARPAPKGTEGLPFDGPAMLMWGTGEYYRKGSLYLAVTRPEEIEEADRMYYFAGLDGAGKPMWSRSEAEAVPVLRHNQIGEFSVVYSEDLDIWLLTYNSGSPRGINLHWAHEPWGPWRQSLVIFEPWLDGGYARYMHALNMPNAKLAGPVINPQPPAVEQWGGEYAPYMIERYLRYRDGQLTIYYLMSTWNPYVVVLMRTDLDVVFEPVRD